jgi:hypothetical protein
MKNIYITENQLKKLYEQENEEVTFYEFFVNVKKYLKDLLTKPADAEPSSILTRNVSKNELLKKMTDLGIIKKNEKIDEVPVEEDTKKVAKHFVQYKVPKRNFEEKVKELYKEVVSENISKSVFGNEQELVDEIKNMDYDNAYATRGGLNEEGEGGGATSCGSVMQGGGLNPDAGQYTTPFGNVQRRSFYGDTLKRNKDSKNGSISMNRKK